MLLRSTFLVSLCVTACAQTLEITPAAVDRGSANIFRIVLKPRADKPIAALQWDLVYSGGLRIEAAGVLSGAASEKAGKSVTCGSKPSTEGGNHRLTCILAGGVQVLSAGAVAIVRFEAVLDTPKGETIVGLEKVAGVSPALEPVPMENTRTSITIR